MSDRSGVDAERLRRELGDRWARVTVVEESPSTNAVLLEDSSAPDRTVLLAELQTAGRGRLDRTWTSPRGAGLTLSVLLRPPVPLPVWGWLPLLAGVALHEAVVSATGVPAGLKWPNDLLAGPELRKAAGILAQSSGDVAVIGIGLNVSTTADELPVPTATSLALAGADEVDRTELAVAILRRLDARAAQWADVGGDAEACGLAAAYRDACRTLGSDVRVTLGDGDALEGRAVGIDGTGRLLVRTAAGERTVGAGDVEHVRASR